METGMLRQQRGTAAVPAPAEAFDSVAFGAPRGILRFGAVASGSVALTILVAGAAFAVSRASALIELDTSLRGINAAHGAWLVAHTAYLALAVLFPLALPGLRALAGRDGAVYSELGASLGLAAVGPLVLAALLAFAFLPLAAEYVRGVATDTVLLVARALQTMERFSFMAMGVLVGGSVGCFGLALRRAGRHRVGILGAVGGLLFAAGTLGPPLLPVFALANVLGIVWFAAVGLALRESARTAAP